jgi:hypothetical protein
MNQEEPWRNSASIDAKQGRSKYVRDKKNPNAISSTHGFNQVRGGKIPQPFQRFFLVGGPI